MRDIFIDKLNFKPNHDLKSNTSNVLTITNLMHSHIKKISPDYVIVYGDTSSSMTAANVAENIKSKIIHLEGGVQDYDYNVPEELLRIKIDEMADYLFTPSDLCKCNLSYEQIKGQIFNSGHLIVDVCRKLSKIALDKPKRKDIPKEYLLLTLHRPENVDDEGNLKLLINPVKKVQYKIVFPIHPRTKNNIKKYNLEIPPKCHPY